MSSELALAFKALGDPVRLRLFHLIGQHDELCVCHLTDALSLPQSTVSRHLGQLRQAGLVTTRRDGKWMHYRINDTADRTLARSLAGLVTPMAGREQKSDEARLKAVLEAKRSAASCEPATQEGIS